jgi:hypothetical protein
MKLSSMTFYLRYLYRLIFSYNQNVLFCNFGFSLKLRISRTQVHIMITSPTTQPSQSTLDSAYVDDDNHANKKAAVNTQDASSSNSESKNYLK